MFHPRVLVPGIYAIYGTDAGLAATTCGIAENEILVNLVSTRLVRPALPAFRSNARLQSNKREGRAVQSER